MTSLGSRCLLLYSTTVCVGRPLSDAMRTADWTASSLLRTCVRPSVISHHCQMVSRGKAVGMLARQYSTVSTVLYCIHRMIEAQIFRNPKTGGSLTRARGSAISPQEPTPRTHASESSEPHALSNILVLCKLGRRRSWLRDSPPSLISSLSLMR